MPAQQDPIEPMFDDGWIRIWRSHDLDRGVGIFKEALGQGAPDRIAHEISILSRLDGVPGVPRVRHAQNPHALVFADRGGRVLADVLAERRQDAREVLDLGEGLARILAAVHQAGVAHHDLHPWNVLLTKDGDIELINFERATTTAEIRAGFPHQREIVGRLPYMSPEQTGRTGSAVDGRSDLYALGAVLYEAATGRPPFDEVNAFELVRDVLTREPTPLTQLEPTMPPALGAVVGRLLEKEPDRRYQSAGGLAHDLARIAAEPASTFSLGERDFPSRLPAPARVVGRAAEITVLSDALDAVSRSADDPVHRPRSSPVVLVRGGAGIGKSALVNTLRPLVNRRGGWFVSGKADQVARDFSTCLHAALRLLARLLLAESPPTLEAQVRLIRQRLGSNTAVLVGVAPEFAQVLGQHEGPGDLDEREFEDRTRQAVLQLLRAVASPARPLVVFLDDIQWAPQSVLAVLDAIVNDPVQGLLLVGAYRDDESDDSHIAELTTVWERHGIEPTTLRLTPLERDDVATLLGQVLRLPVAPATALACVIHERTAGNPFNTIELVNSLREDGVLALVDDGWTWDANEIRHHVGASDVIALLTTRIESVGHAAASVLSAMACLGGEVSHADLAIACGLTASQLDTHLAQLLQADLVTAVSHGHPEDAAFGFRHDRVQEAAFERLGTDERRGLQAQMGRRLATAGRDLYAAQQLLAADNHSADPEEHALLVRLFRAAADHERRRTTFTVAEHYLAAAARILQDEVGVAAERAHFAVESDRHQVLYQLGRLDEADAIYAALCARTSDARELAQVTATQVASLTNRNLSQAAVELGLTMLTRLGMRYPQDDAEAEVAQGLAEVAVWAAGLDAAADAGRPALSDPVAALLGAVMARLSPPAFFTAPLVSGWLVTQARRLWVEHGPSSDLMAVLGHGPVAFVAVLDEFRAGECLLSYLIAVGEAHRWERAVAYARFLYAASSAHWFEPLEACVAAARQARDGLLHVGDLPQAGWAYFPLVVDTFETAAHIDHPLTEFAAALSLADRTGILPVQICVSIMRRFCRAAQGVTAAGSPQSPPDIDEETVEALADVIPIVDAYLRLFRSITAALTGDAAWLAANSRAAFRQAQHLPGIVITLLATVPFGLDLSLQLRRVSPGDRAHVELLAELDMVLAWLRRRAQDQPHNVAHLVHYLAAERAWALHDHDGATVAFDAALSAVHHRSRPWHHALLARRAGELHCERGFEHSGRLHLAEARQALLDWGANALAAELDRTYPFLRVSSISNTGIGSASPSSVSSPAMFTADAIETTAILRVAQALAAQTTMTQLHSAIVDQLSAITGATALQLVLPDEATGWRIHRTTADDPALDAACAAALLPVSAVRYVLRTRATLAVDDATCDDRFARDPYLMGKPHLALLVVPVLRSGDLRAVLVLENRLASGTFTHDRLDVVNMLTGQLAVALDNALLYTSLEQRIAERTEELRSANAKLELISATDALTGVANRRSFDTALAAEWTRSPGQPMSVVMADVDHFKDYNDHHGHPAGDACLIEISTLLKTSLRDTDMLCRYGGEEFAAILPGADLDVAKAVAERMRMTVEAAALPHTPGIATVTISVGVASALGSPSIPASALLARADTALYVAKHAGRNCVRHT